MGRRIILNRGLPALVIFGASLVLYLRTICPSWFPIDSASTVAMHLGINPFAPLDHPLWGAVIRGIDLLPWGSTVQRMNGFSALCGAFACSLIYLFVVQFSHDRSMEERHSGGPSGLAAQVSGIAAAAVLMVSLPFWIVSTRAHPLPFDLCILLGILLLARHAWIHERRSWFYLSALLYGVAVVEFPSLLILFPVFFVMGLQRWFVITRDLRPGNMLRLPACFLAGSLVFLIPVYALLHHPSAAWHGIDTFGEAFVKVGKYQALIAGRVIPRLGWLLIALTTALPLVFILVRKEGLKRSLYWTSWLFHFVCLLVGSLILANTAISPWAMLQLSPVVATPYLMLALWMGYLCGYGLMLFGGRSPFPHSRWNTFRKPAAALWLISFSCFVAWCGLRNRTLADGAVTRGTGEWAAQVLDRLEGRDWLVTLQLDNVIALEARERGLDLKIINPALAHSEAYPAWLASHFENPRLRAMARVGVSALLSEWIRIEPEAAGRLLMSQAELWQFAGLEPVPEGVVYRGVPPDTALDTAALFAKEQAGWNRAPIGAAVMPDSGMLLGPHLGAYRLALSRSANNLGVLLEEQGDAERAEQAYLQARRFAPGNVSALLNLVSLGSRREIADAETIQREFQDLMANLRGRYGLWSLSYRFGFVRHPEAYVARGLTWAVSGRQGRAFADLEQAASMAKDDARMQLSLAGLQLSARKVEDSAKTYAALLEKNADDAEALRGMARVDMLRGDYDAARSRLDRLEELAGTSTAVLLERVALETFLGNLEGARKRVEDVLDRDEHNVKALAGLAFLAAREDDSFALDRAVKRLQETEKLPAHVRLAFAQLLASRGRVTEAIVELNQLLAVEPWRMDALEYLLRLEVRERKQLRAVRLARHILGIDSGNAYANEVLGSVEFAVGNHPLAESFYRASIASQRSSGALNSLAFVLSLDGRYGEALPLVEEALQVNPNNGAAWDTLAVVQLGLNHLAEADEAIQKALTYSPGSASLQFHLAQIHAAQGRTDAALRVLEELKGRLGEFSRTEQEAIRVLRESLSDQ